MTEKNFDEIPDFLRISAEDRKKAWVGFKHTNPHEGGTDEAWKQREQARRHALEAEKKAKNAAGLARLKSEHEGERYDRKLKMWVPCK
jgi:hypothetical protein